MAFDQTETRFLLRDRAGFPNIFWLVIVVYVCSLGFYIYKLGWLSNSVQDWGQFGDFIGGFINPIVGLVTIVLFAASLKQNHTALSQSETALYQNQEILRATLDELELLRKTQAATEAALQEQIKISDHARDMNNAIALWGHLDLSCVNLDKTIQNESSRTNNRDQNKINELVRHSADTKRSLQEVGHILTIETNRLRAKYLNKD